MLSDLISYLIIFVFVVILSLLIDFEKSKTYWYVLLLFLIIGFADNMVYSLTSTNPKIQLVKAHIWEHYLLLNWSAKLYSIVLGLILLIPLRIIISFNEIGLRFKQNENSIKLSLSVVLVYFLINTAGLLGNRLHFDLNALLYYAFMPSISEEFIYRGLLLGLLNLVFYKKFKLLGTNFGWGAILVSIAFGLLNGFHINNHTVNFDFWETILTCIYGFILALIKERSGSLVFPIIAHSVFDFFYTLFQMI